MVNTLNSNKDRNDLLAKAINEANRLKLRIVTVQPWEGALLIFLAA